MAEGEGEVCVAFVNDGIVETESSVTAELKLNFQWILGGTDAEPRAKKHAIGASNDNTRIKSCAKSPKKEALNDAVLKPCLKCSADESFSNVASEPFAESEQTEVLKCAKIVTNEAFSVADLESCDELEHCDPLQTNEALSNNKDLVSSDKKHMKELSDNTELDGVKEASDEDILAEVSDPNLSPRDITSSIKTISGCPNELGCSKIQGGFGEASSLCSGNSSIDGSLSDGVHSRNNGTGELSTSCVVLEIPKHVSTTGIRNITFKFSKRKEDYGDLSSLSAAQPVSGEYGDGCHKVNAQSASVIDLVNRDVYLNTYENLFHETRLPFTSVLNKELKMSKKVVPDNYPANVKKLLSTGILEGARVKYISANRGTELSGIIRDGKYSCSYSLCNFSRAQKPNTLGKPIYGIIQELKTAPPSMIDEVIKDVAGSYVNKEYFQVWKGENLCCGGGGQVNLSLHLVQSMKLSKLTFDDASILGIYIGTHKKMEMARQKERIIVDFGGKLTF